MHHFIKYKLSIENAVQRWSSGATPSSPTARFSYSNRLNHLYEFCQRRRRRLQRFVVRGLDLRTGRKWLQKSFLAELYFNPMTNIQIRVGSCNRNGLWHKWFEVIGVCCWIDNQFTNNTPPHLHVGIGDEFVQQHTVLAYPYIF